MEPVRKGKIILLTALLLVLWCALPAKAAGPYTVQMSDDDTSLFVYDTHLQGVAILQVKGKQVEDSIYATKKGIYFFSYNGSLSPPGEYSLHRYSFRTGKSRKLCDLPGRLLEISFHYLKGGLLSFSGWSVAEGNLSFLYDVYKGTLTEIGSGLQITGKFKSYLLLDGNEGSSIAYDPFPLVLYDMNTGKSKRVADHVDAYLLDPPYLYYAQTDGDMFSLLIPHDILRLDLRTGKKKVLLRSLSCFLIDSLQPDCVLYRTERFGECCRYSFATGTTVEVDDITGLPAGNETAGDQLLRAGVNLIRGKETALDYCAEDIDKDGIPELFLEYSPGGGDYSFTVYAYNGKKYKRVGKIPGGTGAYAQLASWPGENALLCHLVYGGRERILCYRLLEGKLTKRTLYSARVYNAGQIRYYAYHPLSAYNTPVNYAFEGYRSQYFREFSDPYVKGSLLLQRCPMDSFVAFRQALRFSASAAGN